MNTPETTAETTAQETTAPVDPKIRAMAERFSAFIEAWGESATDEDLPHIQAMQVMLEDEQLAQPFIAMSKAGTIEVLTDPFGGVPALIFAAMDLGWKFHEKEQGQE